MSILLAAVPLAILLLVGASEVAQGRTGCDAGYTECTKSPLCRSSNRVQREACMGRCATRKKTCEAAFAKPKSAVQPR
jgi:hypothetical protein